MSKKDFALIASTVRHYIESRDDNPWTLPARFADALADTNPNFKREKFIRAAIPGNATAKGDRYDV